MSKVVVEDQGGRISYSEGWEKNAVCVACDTTVDKVLQAASAGTWMQTWWATGRSQVSATLDFEGTGVDAYFLFFWRSQDPNSTGDSSLLFFVDDKLEMTRPISASDFSFAGDIAPRALVFSKSGYSAAKHTLRIHWTNSGPRPRVAVALDKIEYTPIRTVAPTSNAPAAPTTSTSSNAIPTTANPTVSSSSTTTGTGNRPSGTTTQTSSSSSTFSASDSTGTGLSGAAGPPDGGSGGSGSSSSSGSSGSNGNNGTTGNSGSDRADQTGATSNNVAKIVGPVVAVVVVLALLIGGFILWRRRRRRAREMADYVDNGPVNLFAPTAYESSPFNHAVANNAPTMYMTGSHFPASPVSHVPQPVGAAQQPQQYGHQRTLSPDSNSQYSWNAASAYTGITSGSGGSNPFVGSSEMAPTNAAAVAPSTVYSPPPYSVGTEQVVGARGSEKRRVVH